MHSILFAIAAIVPLAALHAQAGNEVVFVGSSVGGVLDPHWFVESGTGLLYPGTGTDNVTDAVWADTGRNLYVALSLQANVLRAQWNGSAASWQVFAAAPGSCYGLGLDAPRKRLWVLTGTTGSTRELHCFDADPASPGYGAPLVQTTVLSGVLRERWELSPSGNLAVVPSVLLGGVTIVDTDPNSPTFLQAIVSLPVPGASGAGIAVATAAAVRSDDQYAHVLWTGVAGVAGIAVLHVPTQTWLDFDPAPGHQDMALGPAQIPNGMALSLAGSFAVVSAQGGSGAVVRVDFDYTTPANTTVTPLGAGVNLTSCDNVSLSPENARAAVTATSPVRLVILDVLTGAPIHNLTLTNGSGPSTTAWQDASPTATFTPYGTGCAGTLGVPTWAAAPGSRPALGSTFTAVAGNLPFGIAVAQIGFTGTPGGVSLGFLGMPSCSIYPTPIVSLALVGAGSTASWALPIPNTQGLFGAELHSQAFPLDPAATAFGFTASNAALGVLGY